MATYMQIQNWVKQNSGFVPKSCWIAHCKEMVGLNPKVSARRYDSNVRQFPCPLNKQSDIVDAFRHFGMVN